MIKKRNKSLNLKDCFTDHRLVTSFNDPMTGLRGFIAIHRGGLVNPAFGATRLWTYINEDEALQDALSLSRIMSYKSVMAGLKYGGAKAVILCPAALQNKTELIKKYSSVVDSLGGRFVTGADVGIDEKALKEMASCCKHIVGLKGDPVKHTAMGVYYSLQIAFEQVFGLDSIKERSFAIQGLGKTGMAILKLLYPNAKKIYVADIDQTKTKTAKGLFPKIQIVNYSIIHKQPVDVFMPCALSGAINSQNASSIKARIVVGSANNQLENVKAGELLYKRDILYLPDYVVNAGGLITVVDEYENPRFSDKRVGDKVKMIGERIKIILDESRKYKKAPIVIADEMAEKLSNKII